MDEPSTPDPAASPTTDPIDTAMASVTRALAAGDFDAAVTVLEALTESGGPPHAHWLLGGLRYIDDDFDLARHHLEDAYRGFRAIGDTRHAARVAADLAEIHWAPLGNRSASRGWAGRAQRLLDREGRCVELGYLNLALVACEQPDVEALERMADEALELAIEFGDPALEARALADSGYALVSQGRIGDGFARLDQAMAALSSGEVTDLGMVGKSFCAMLSACDQTGAVERAEEWTRLMNAALIERFGGRPRILHTHCRLAYGSVLCSVGRWSDGEAALLEALDDSASQSTAHRGDAAARLALLRVMQGRLAEAAELLRPHEDRPYAAAPLAMVHAANGEHALAIAVLQRGIEQIVGDRFREGALLALLVEIELAHDIDRAASAAERLAEVASRADVPVLRSEALLAAGRVAAARGDAQAAADVLAEAMQLLQGDERPMLCGMIRFERARALAASGDLASGVGEARAAFAIFERLGAEPQIDRTAALLRSLGAPGRPRTSSLRAAVEQLTARERDVLELMRQGLTNAEIGTRLYISPKTVEHHVGRVLAKLGVRSRAEAAAVATSILRPSG